MTVASVVNFVCSQCPATVGIYANCISVTQLKKMSLMIAHCWFLDFDLVLLKQPKGTKICILLKI